MKKVGDKNYYTVKEFAAAANISNKAVYQQLKTRLKGYSKKIDGVTMISESALVEFYEQIQVNSSQVDLNLESRMATDFGENVQVNSSQASRQNSSQVSSLERDNDNYIKHLEEELKAYKEQVKEKDKTISDMQQQIVTLSNNLAEISKDSLQQIASITKNIQLLQAAEVHEDIINNQEKEIIEQPKKRWFQKLRGK